MGTSPPLPFSLSITFDYRLRIVISITEPPCWHKFDTKMSVQKKRKVMIVGGGAAGMSCAATLAQHPENFEVTIIERNDVTGGQATSISIDKERYGTDWMNDGVQGGSPIFKHTFNFFKKYGHEPQEVKLQVAFGKGPDGIWTNCFPSNLINQYSGDIRKFGKVLKLIKWTMPLLGLVPIRIMLRMFFFSKDFGDKMVYPLIALFLGTGNQTANVSCAILERLVDDPNMKLWDYDAETLFPNLPTMVTFPNLHNFYEDWRKDLQSKGVEIRLKTEVAEITQRNDQGVVIQTRPSSEDRDDDTTTSKSKTETFDELVMCVLADDAPKLLGKTASRKEKFVLGGASFYDDITITHSDSNYFKKHYETEFDPKLCADPKHRMIKSRLRRASRRDQMEKRRGSDQCTTPNRTSRIQRRSRCHSTARTTSINSETALIVRILVKRHTCIKAFFSIREMTSSGLLVRLTRRRSLRGSGGISWDIDGSTMFASCQE